MNTTFTSTNSTHTTSKPINYKEVYFNHPSLKKLTENPNYADLQYFYKHIKANDASISSTIGEGIHGHLGLVIYTVTYNRIIPNNPYLCQTHPAPLGFINVMTAQIAEGVHQNNILITTFHEANHIERTIINQVQAYLGNSVLVTKINKNTGVLDCDIIDLMKYLLGSYGNISDQKLHDKHIKTTHNQYVHNNPIANIFNAIHTYSAMS